MVKTNIQSPGANRQALTLPTDVASGEYTYYFGDIESSSRHYLSDLYGTDFFDIENTPNERMLWQGHKGRSAAVVDLNSSIGPIITADLMQTRDEAHWDQNDTQNDVRILDSSLRYEWYGLLSGIQRKQQIEWAGDWLPFGSPSDLDQDLTDALEDLDKAIEEALEEELPIPSQKLLDDSGHLLRRLYEVWPRRFEVYPMPDGEIAIDARNGRGSAILLLCEPAGGVLCLRHIEGVSDRQRYASIDELPDTFLRNSLTSLFQEPD